MLEPLDSEGHRPQGLCDTLEATVRIRLAILVSVLPATLIGCSMSPTASAPADAAVAIEGSVHGGMAPLAGAHIYMLAANTTGYGQPSLSLLDASSAGASDSIGAYVTTDSTGHFNIPSGFTCSSTTEVYLYALGGNSGGGTNPAAGLLAALGSCPSNSDAAPSNYVVNEVSTVAAAYAMAGFAVDATHVSSSGTPLAVTDISNAFANAANLYSATTGTALGTTPAGNGTVPSEAINTLANILASCVQSSSSTSAGCSSLFAHAQGASGSTPTDTASAAINIAHNAGANVAALYSLATANMPFGPSLPAQPNDFTLGINFTGGGLNGPYAAAIDAEGNAWFANLGNNTISKLNPMGAAISPATGYTNGTPIGPVGIAIDLSGDPWIVNAVSSSLTKYQASGALLSPQAGYTGGGLAVPQGLATDALGNIWVANALISSVSKFSNGGVAISPSTGYTGGGIAGSVAIAIDASGAVWVTNTEGSPTSVSKLTSAGQPISPPNGYVGGGIRNPFSIAIDNGGNAWVVNFGGNSVTKLTTSGDAISPSSGFTGGGLSLPFSIAIDGGGNAWIANSGAFSVTELTNEGVPVSPATGFQGGLINGPQAIAVDGSGNVWVANSDDISVTEFVGASVPVVTPIVTGVKNNTLGSRP